MGSIGTEFSFGRSEFDSIVPGTKQVIRTDSNFGRIVSVIEQHCLDLIVDSNYPIAEECAEINDTTNDQAWQITNNNQVRYLDIDQKLGYDDFFVCLHAFGDKDDNTGFVRVRECPGELDDDYFNSQWDFTFKNGDPLQFRLRNTAVDMCLGDDVVQVKAGKPGKPGPARVRETWSLVDCDSAPWWHFLHLFENWKIDERLCKVAGDPESCIAYKSNGKDFGGGEILELDVNDIDLNTLDLPEDYDSDKLAELLAQYKDAFAYYYSNQFADYDYAGYAG